MKVVIVKEQGTDSLIPLTLSETDSVEMLRQHWSAATGRDSLDYFFKCCDVFIEDTQLISDLPSLASSSSCVEVTAERSIQLQLRPFGLVGRNLEMKVPLSLEVGLLTAALCNALEVPPRPVTFYRAAEAGMKEKALGPLLSPKLSLGEQGVSENEVLEAVLHVEVRVGNRQLMCAGHADIASLFDPDLQRDAQRLCFGNRVLPETGDLLTVLPEALFSPTPVELTVEWSVTLKFRFGDSEAAQASRGWSQQSVWEAFAASSEVGATDPSGSELALWLSEEELDPATLVSELSAAAPGGTILLAVDKPCDVRVRLGSGAEAAFRLRRGARVSQLAALVAQEEGEAEGEFRLALEGDPLPPEASLRQCGLQPGCLLRIERHEVPVLLSYELRPAVSCTMRPEAAFPALLARAQRSLKLPEAAAGLQEFRCGCGSRVKAADPKCNTLPAACCRAEPRPLRLLRLVTVRVVRMFLPDAALLSERFDSTATARDVRKALLRRAREPPAELKWRLCHRGRLLSDDKALCDLQAGSEELELELEAQLALCITAGPHVALWLAWPNSTTDSLLAELRTAGVAPPGPQLLLLHGRELDLRKEGRWVTLWSNGLRNGNEVKVVPEEDAKRSELKEVKDLKETKKETVTHSTVKVICRNWGAPDFETSVSVPITINEARQLVANKFNVHSSKVHLMQHRAKLPDGSLLIDIGNYRWSDTNGEIYKDAECTPFKYNLEKGPEVIPIPGNHRWKLFVRYIAE